MQISAPVKVLSLPLQLQMRLNLVNGFQVMMAVRLSLNERAETIGQVRSTSRAQVEVCLRVDAECFPTLL